MNYQGGDRPSKNYGVATGRSRALAERQKPQPPAVRDSGRRPEAKSPNYINLADDFTGARGAFLDET
jgi:hypothetical protein